MRTLEQIEADLNHLIHLRNPLIIEMVKWHAVNTLHKECAEYGAWMKAHPELTALACLLVVCEMRDSTALRLTLTGAKGHVITHMAVELVQADPLRYTVTGLVAALRDSCSANLDEPIWDKRFQPLPLIGAGYLTWFDCEKEYPIAVTIGEKGENLSIAWEVHGLEVTDAEIEKDAREEIKTRIEAAFNPDLPPQ